MRVRIVILQLLTATALAAGTLDPSLEAELDRDPASLTPVVVVLAERPADLHLDRYATALAPEERRAARWALLEEMCGRSQSPVLDFLYQAEAPGLAEDIRPLVLLNAVGARVTAEIARELADLPGVDRVALCSTTDDALCSSADITWNVSRVEAPLVWDAPYGYTGDGVVVAVVDTGCDFEHPDLADHPWVNLGEIPGNGLDDDANGYVDDVNGWDFYYDDGTVLGPEDGHGSHVAGIVAGDGSAGSQTGVAPDARIMAVKVFSDTGRGTEYITWDGMDYAVEMGADVLNLSFGWYQNQTHNQPLWRDVCRTTLELGAVIVAAAGNEGDKTEQYPPPDNIRTPGDVPEIITVGATESADGVSFFSSIGPVEWAFDPPYDDWPYPPGCIKPDICAPGGTVNPGEGIKSIDGRRGGYINMEGTSMSTPHVAGAVALLLQADPSLTPQEVKDYLELSALDLGEAGKDNYAGYGRLQCLLALLAMQAGLRFTDFGLTQDADGVLAYWTLTRSDLVEGYRLYRKVDLGLWEPLNTDSVATGPYLDREVEWGRQYAYRVVALVSGGGELSRGPETLVYGQGMPTPRAVLGHPYPSPADGVVNFVLMFPIDARVELTVYDLAGRRVARPYSGEHAAGRETVTLTTDGLAPGVYLAELTDKTSGAGSLQRFVIAR
ncbi:MAG: S8 family serine peptidase [bacterium]|nr:S8 family serine peptidase [bacterium]